MISIKNDWRKHKPWIYGESYGWNKKVFRTLNYTEHLLILASGTTGWVSMCAFASLVGIFVGIAGSALELKTCITLKIISH